MNLLRYLNEYCCIYAFRFLSISALRSWSSFPRSRRQGGSWRSGLPDQSRQGRPCGRNRWQTRDRGRGRNYTQQKSRRCRGISDHLPTLLCLVLWPRRQHDHLAKPNRPPVAIPLLGFRVALEHLLPARMIRSVASSRYCNPAVFVRTGTG